MPRVLGPRGKTLHREPHFPIQTSVFERWFCFEKHAPKITFGWELWLKNGQTRQLKPISSQRRVSRDSDGDFATISGSEQNSTVAAYSHTNLCIRAGFGFRQESFEFGSNLFSIKCILNLVCYGNGLLSVKLRLRGTSLRLKSARG